nr:GTPase ObgE [Lachnospiraceae bacterium]
MRFADRATIIIGSGKGGDGHVSFRREKYVPNGGPDGGDGGKGGDLIFEVDSGINNLSDFRHKRKFIAENGQEGGKRNCHGKNGADLVLKVPEGTVVCEAKSGKVIVDMSGENKRVVVLEGGKGGLGNQHFATSSMQAPKYAKPGEDAITLEVTLELKVLADVGLVGFPNVGKSTLLSRLSNAKPEIANYHFTTLSPILGVVETQDAGSFVMADIPGLIEGASEGVGLGHQFLRHIERTKVLVHLVDGASVEGRDPLEDIKAINEELLKYNSSLGEKPQILALNKMDSFQGDRKELLDSILSTFKYDKYDIFMISAVTGETLKELVYKISEKLSKLKEQPTTFESEFHVNSHVDESLSYKIEINEEGEYSIFGPKI